MSKEKNKSRKICTFDILYKLSKINARFSILFLAYIYTNANSKLLWTANEESHL